MPQYCLDSTQYLLTGFSLKILAYIALLLSNIIHLIKRLTINKVTESTAYLETSLFTIFKILSYVMHFSITIENYTVKMNFEFFQLFKSL